MLVATNLCADVSNEQHKGADMCVVGVETPAMQNKHKVIIEAESRRRRLLGTRVSDS